MTYSNCIPEENLAPLLEILSSMAGCPAEPEEIDEICQTVSQVGDAEGWYEHAFQGPYEVRLRLAHESEDPEFVHVCVEGTSPELEQRVVVAVEIASTYGLVSLAE